MQIQWYPGHMTKARRMMSENLKLIDVVVELVDARAPRATRNPDFDDLFSAKSRRCDPEQMRPGRPRCHEGVGGVLQKTGDRRAQDGGDRLLQEGERRGPDRGGGKGEVDRLKAKGVHKTVRVMVVGIPNVGKSTFINKLSGVAQYGHGQPARRHQGQTMG